ncbi:MAG: PAS domain-containing protein, partial [Gammaproteobacteria bacterium]|nr:PAS domain-containing protein [Gammaproteobacteria bacterium]
MKIESISPDLRWLESSSVAGCFVLDRDNRIAWANALFSDWLGFGAGEAAGRHFETWLTREPDLRVLAKARTSKGARNVQLELNGETAGQLLLRGDLLTTGDGNLIGIVRIDADSERLRAGMERSARLEALGSLTSGVAHDFNNLLTILVGNLALVAEDLR